MIKTDSSKIYNLDDPNKSTSKQNLNELITIC